MDIIAGRNPVREALRGRRHVRDIWMAAGIKETAALDDIRRLAKEAGVPLKVVDRREIESLAPGVVHQGVVAWVAPLPLVDVADVVQATAAERAATVVLLDGVTDPQNFGSLLRTAEATGVAAVIVPKRRTAPVTATVVKVSAGATEYVPITQMNLADAVRRLKEAGFWVVGAAAEGGRPYTTVDMSGKTVLVLGSEGAGISRLVASLCDFSATIPMQGRIRSLNVSVAGALLMYEAKRQREAR